MKAFIFTSLIGPCILFCGLDNAHAYNTCHKVGDPSWGIYFETVKRAPGNSSSRLFTDLVLVMGRPEDTLRFEIGGGDKLFWPQYIRAPGTEASYEASLDGSHYVKFNKSFMSTDGKSYLKVQFDRTSEEHGLFEATLADGRKFSFAIDCGKIGDCKNSL